MDEAVRLCPHSKRGHKPYMRKCTEGLPKKCSEKNPAERGEGVPGAGWLLFILGGQGGLPGTLSFGQSWRSDQQPALQDLGTHN